MRGIVFMLLAVASIPAQAAWQYGFAHMTCAEYLYGNDTTRKLMAMSWITGYVSAANEMLEARSLRQIDANTIQWDGLIVEQCKIDMNYSIGSVAQGLVKLHLKYNVSNGR